MFDWGTGDVFLADLAPGQTRTVNITFGNRLRVTGEDFNTNEFDVRFDPPNGCGPFNFNVDPRFCAEVICPPDVEISCVDSTNPNNTGTPSVNCGNPAPTFSDSFSGSCPEILTRTWTYTAGSSVQTCQQIITIQDELDPSLVGVPQNMTVECDNVPNPPNVTATDQCNAVSYTHLTLPTICSV